MKQIDLITKNVELIGRNLDIAEKLQKQINLMRIQQYMILILAVVGVFT